MTDPMARFLGFFGSGGYARETMHIAQFYLDDWERAGLGRPAYVEPEAVEGQKVFGREIISEQVFFSQQGGPSFCVPIADAAIRRAVTDRAIGQGCRLIDLVHPTAIISKDANIGSGAIFSANTIVTSNCKIGVGFHANIFSYVAHDCIIGDYVTCAPRASINGGAVIGDNVYIGTGAIIRHSTSSKPISIGDGAVIGMGAVVTKDVPPGVTVVGNPARPRE